MNYRPMIRWGLVLAVGIVLPSAILLSGKARSKEPTRPECIAPAKPGGGFDLTCKLAVEGFQENNLIKNPIRVTYMPGGVGAVAYNAVVGNRPSDGEAIVAFSSGSLLNLSQKKFGQYDENAVRWLAGIGTDYGMVAVRADSPIKNLNDLAVILKNKPKSISFGAGGSVGGQDWMQVALMTKKIGANPRDMKYVALEGGGDTMTSLLGGHIDVMSAGIAEILPFVKAGKVRVLAVFSDTRLDGALADLPTAKEQGYDVQWPVIRGFYMGPKVSNEEYDWWKRSFDKLLRSDKFERLRANRDLLPFAMTGEELDKYVKTQVKEMHALSQEFDLVVKN